MLPFKQTLFCLLPSFVLFSCNEQSWREIERPASAFDIKQGEASFLQNKQHFMKPFEAGDSETYARLMAPHHTTTMGRKNIINYFPETMRKGISDFDLKAVKVGGTNTKKTV